MKIIKESHSPSQMIDEHGGCDNQVDDLHISVHSGDVIQLNEEDIPSGEAHTIESLQQIKREVTYTENHTLNTVDIDEILQRGVETQISDDVSIIITGDLIPRPIQTTLEGFVKREDDFLSGNKHFNETVIYI